MAGMATVGQRIKAAQARAGMSVAQIAAEDGRPARFSAKTIGRVVRGERDLEPHEADWLAKVLHVPVDTFFQDPPPLPDDAERLDRVEMQLDDIVTRLAHLEEMVTEGLEQLERALNARTDALLPGIRELLEVAQATQAAAQTQTAGTGK